MRSITPDACTIEREVSEAPDAYCVCTRDAAGISSTYWRASIKRLFGVAQVNVLRA